MAARRDATSGHRATYSRSPRDLPKERRALLFNALSGLTFLLGGLLAYAASLRFDVAWLVPLAAGNFLYIGASDLVPEVTKSHSLRSSALHLGAFCAGLCCSMR
jgi:zinc and cadmium transporter